MAEPFDLEEYVKKETEASGVPFHVVDPKALRDGAKLVRSVLEPKRET
jgi:hypothetical protein